TPTTPTTPTIPPVNAPPLPRISSDWDPKQDIFVREYSRHQDVRREFEALYIPERRPTAARMRRTSHHGFFRGQTEDRTKLRVRVDPGAGPDDTVLIDGATTSIYDCYLLRADIMKNVNIFRRFQVCGYACTDVNETDKATFDR